MDTQIDHTYMGIETCIENDQKESGRVPGPRTSDALSQKWGQCSIKKENTRPITYIAKQKLELFEGKLDF